MNKKRPINLSLPSIKFPLPAITSILHRITGIVLFLSIPIVLWMLSQTLESQQSYGSVVEFTETGLGGFVVWGILSALSYHVVAGLKHLIMDMGIGESLEASRMSAKLVIVAGLLIAAFWGVWLW